MSDSVWPHRRQPTRFPSPWDSPGKNTGVGCHFLLQCMKVKSEREVAQSCPTLSNPTDCSPPGPSVHGILQARVLEWGAIAFSTQNPNTAQSSEIWTASLLLLLSRVSRVRLCVTPIDGSPPGSPVPGILQARILEWVAISFNVWKWKVKVSRSVVSDS